MAPMRIRPLVVLALLVQFLVCQLAAAIGTGQHGPHISNLNVLLPPRSSRPVPYHLQGYNGCFTWTWDHHDILQVDAQYNDTNKACSTSAVLTSIASYSGRKTTAVHATDSVTGQILRCEVFIDKISRIQIFHHSLKLDLDGLATLRIRAFDTEDNVFSSLAGLQFMWQLSPLSQTGDVAHRLLHVPLKQTALIDGEIDDQIELEENGLGSDLYVVRGVGAGQERVTAHFMEKGFENLSHVITLTVAEAVSLNPPSPVFMIPGTQLQFSLRALRRNEVKVIRLPSPHHRWSVDNYTVAGIDTVSGVITALTYGSTVVTVEDLRLTGHQQTSTIYVVRPISLVLSISPLLGKGSGAVTEGKQSVIMSDRSWQVVAGRKYVVQVFAFSMESGNKPLLLTKDNDLTMPNASPPYWKVSMVPEAVAAEQGWRNCSLMETGTEGNGNLVASLSHGVMVEDILSGTWLLTNKQLLTSEAEVRVCAQVKLIKLRYGDYMSLPWAPGHEQEHRLFAEGGCGKATTDYDWSSSDPAVATVNVHGVVQSKGLGRTVIRATALGDALNDDEIIVEVSYPRTLGIVSGLPVEMEVGSYIPAAVGLRDPSGLEYASCDAFNKVVQWGLFGGDGTFSVVKEKLNSKSSAFESIHPHACSRTLISAARPGRATVRASLNVGELLLGLTSLEIEHPFLEVSWPIAAFAPLTLKQARGGDRHGGYSLKSMDAELSSLRLSIAGQLGELLLVPRSSMSVILRGGPERWRQGVEFVDSYEVINDQGAVSKDNVEVSHLKDGENWVYDIECKVLGTYTVNFYRGNLVGEDHPTKSVATVSLLVTCAFPSAITLLADEAENTMASIKVASHAKRDKDKSRIDAITVINDRTIRIAAVSLDDAGRPFSNASSLSVSWKFTGCKDLAQWVEKPKLDVGPQGWERMIALGNVAGRCFVRADVQGFVKEYEGAFSVLGFGMSFASSHGHLHDAVTLQLVAALRIEPRNLLLFHHPDSKASLSILGGTSEVEARANDSRIVDVILLDTRGLIVAARDSGDAIITVRDVGLATPASASALVTVSDVAAVKMLLPDDTSLQVGSCMTVQVQAADSSGRIFDSSQFSFMNLRIHLQDNVLVTKTQAAAPPTAANEFVICGANVGLTTKLHVSVLQKFGKEVFSDFVPFSVYTQLSIHPSSLVLAPGAKYMLVLDGGPQTGVLFNFDATNPEVVKIDPSSGLLEAKAPGRATIQAQARSHSGELLSEAQLNMTVQVPVSMRLDVRGGQLAVGREITIFPHGLGENLFAFYEQCRNYKWTVGNDQVLALAGADGSSGEGKVLATSEDVRSLRKNWGKRDESAGTPYGFSARVIGKTAGRTTVTLTFNCQFHFNGQKVEKEFNPSGTVWVVPDPPLALGMGATWVLPPSYTSSSLLPQVENPVPGFSDPGNSGHSVVYSVMQEACNDANAITVTDTGVIQTSDKTDLTCIHARDRTTGRSEIAACVRVAEISSLTVGDGKLAVPVAELSVGTEQKLAVTLRDDLGVPFLEAGVKIPITLETNRGDLISVKLADYETIKGSTMVTILVQTMRQGSALVRVTYKNSPHAVDWLLVNVGAYVFPRNPVLHIGNRLNFSILGKLLHGLPAVERGSWFSTNGSVVRVDSTSGEAQAIAEGLATVSFNGTRLTTYTTVHVIRVASVQVKVPTGVISNVPTPPEGYAFPVTFSDAHGRDVGMIGENREVSYSCRVEPAFIGEAKAWREPGGSVFQCVFLPYQPADLREAYQKFVTSKFRTSSKYFNGKLQFSMIARVEGASGVEGSAEAWFAGGFEVVDSLPFQLTLSSEAREWEFAVVGGVNPDIVQPRITGRPEAFSVQLQNLKAETTGAGGRAIYKLKVLAENKPISDSLVIKSSLTGQEVELPIIFKPGKASVVDKTAQIVTAVIIILLLLILPLVLCARLLDLKRSSMAARTPDVIPGEEPAAKGVQFETTPLRQRTIGSPQTPRTPRTPPSAEGFGYRSPSHPYTEYVSRTLDSTPYFSREGYRKYDPSYNSY